MSKITIIEGNSNSKDDVRAYMVKGERGYSAYEIAVRNGYEGTEAEWKEAFLNPDGYCTKNWQARNPITGTSGIAGVPASAKEIICFCKIDNTYERVLSIPIIPDIALRMSDFRVAHIGTSGQFYNHSNNSIDEVFATVYLSYHPSTSTYEIQLTYAKRNSDDVTENTILYIFFR